VNSINMARIELQINYYWDIKKGYIYKRNNDAVRNGIY
jgi:hypothetical protein